MSYKVNIVTQESNTNKTEERSNLVSRERRQAVGRPPATSPIYPLGVAWRSASGTSSSPPALRTATRSRQTTMSPTNEKTVDGDP